MTIKTRRLLFYSAFILFIITGLGAVFYSWGWRINLKNEDCSVKTLANCFQKTGGVYIETQPKSALIKIDGKTFKDKSGLIQSGTLISNLLPKKYKVEIKKEGYRPYQKNIKVEPNLVAEIPNTVLIPEKFEETPIKLPKPIDNFWLASEKIVFQNKKVLYYFGKDSSIKLRGDEFVAWSEDAARFIVKDSKNQIFYLYDLNNLSKTFNISAAFGNLKKKSAIAQIAFHPADPNRLIVQDKNSLNLFDLNRLQLEVIIKEPLAFWTIKNPNIFYIKAIDDKRQTTNDYLLNSFNLILKNENLIARFPPSNQPNAASPVNRTTVSPDNKKIAFLNKNGEINIYFLEDYRWGINKKAGETVALNIFKNQKIKNIFWYKDSYHLLVEYENGLDFVEIDVRLPINKYTLSEKISNSYYDSKLNRLYFIKENKLYFIEI
jgi:hypothetical protein